MCNTSRTRSQPICSCPSKHTHCTVRSSTDMVWFFESASFLILILYNYVLRILEVSRIYTHQGGCLKRKKGQGSYCILRNASFLISIEPCGFLSNFNSGCLFTVVNKSEHVQRRRIKSLHVVDGRLVLKHSQSRCIMSGKRLNIFGYFKFYNNVHFNSSQGAGF